LPKVPARPDSVTAKSRRTLGADIFLESALSSDALGKNLERIVKPTPLKLKMISNRGTKVYPSVGAMTDTVDHWRCRFVMKDPTEEAADTIIADLLKRLSSEHRWMHVEKLPEFDGVLGFTRAQGED
jgi:isocitrate dehydrogenase